MALLRASLLILAVVHSLVVAHPLAARGEDDALDALRARAEQGDASAQRDVGVRFFQGKGVAQDDAAAARWLRRAADQGHADAQSKLGFLYTQGRGVSRDDAEATRWYRRAAEQGDANGQFNLGLAYEAGRGVAPDDEEAAEWWRRAAMRGHTLAQVSIALAYARGQGVRRDPARACFFAELAASGLPDEAPAAQRKSILELRDSLAAALHPDALAEVRRAARDWEPEP